MSKVHMHFRSVHLPLSPYPLPTFTNSNQSDRAQPFQSLIDQNSAIPLLARSVALRDCAKRKLCHGVRVLTMEQKKKTYTASKKRVRSKLQSKEYESDSSIVSPNLSTPASEQFNISLKVSIICPNESTTR